MELNLEEIREIMVRHLGKDLFRHSLGTAQTAYSLAERYGEEPERAYLAGMVHDYGKVYSSEAVRRWARGLKLKLDQVTLAEPGLLHAPVGAALLPLELGLKDAGVLRAVAYHTTCRPGASLLERIVYLADYIEPGREFPGLGPVREAAEKNLRAALVMVVEQTIRRILDRGRLLHPRSVEFRNSLLRSKI